MPGIRLSALLRGRRIQSASDNWEDFQILCDDGSKSHANHVYNHQLEGTIKLPHDVTLTWGTRCTMPGVPEGASAEDPGIQVQPDVTVAGQRQGRFRACLRSAYFGALPGSCCGCQSWLDDEQPCHMARTADGIALKYSASAGGPCWICTSVVHHIMQLCFLAHTGAVQHHHCALLIHWLRQSWEFGLSVNIVYCTQNRQISWYFGGRRQAPTQAPHHARQDGRALARSRPAAAAGPSGAVAAAPRAEGTCLQPPSRHQGEAEPGSPPGERRRQPC